MKQLCAEAVKNPTADASARLVKATKVVYGLSLRDLEKQWRANWKTVARQLNTGQDTENDWDYITNKARIAIAELQQEANALGYYGASTDQMLLDIIGQDKNQSMRQDLENRISLLEKNVGMLRTQIHDG